MENLFGLSEQAAKEIAGRIMNRGALECCRVLLAGMAQTGVFVPVPHLGSSGRSKKAVHFCTAHGRYFAYFSFIANQQHLLWYFRRPGLRDGVFTFEALAGRLPGFALSHRKPPAKAEGQLHLDTRAVAQEVLEIVRDCIAGHPARFPPV